VVERSEHHRWIEAATFRIPATMPAALECTLQQGVREQNTLKRELQRWATQMMALFRGVSRAHCSGIPPGCTFVALAYRRCSLRSTAG